MYNVEKNIPAVSTSKISKSQMLIDKYDLSLNTKTKNIL